MKKQILITALLASLFFISGAKAVDVANPINYVLNSFQPMKVGEFYFEQLPLYALESICCGNYCCDNVIAENYYGNDGQWCSFGTKEEWYESRGCSGPMACQTDLNCPPQIPLCVNNTCEERPEEKMNPSALEILINKYLVWIFIGIGVLIVYGIYRWRKKKRR